MADKPLSLQDHFLNGVRRAKAPVTIFLVKGIKLHGVIIWFDAFSLLLRREGVAQLVYKHAISTIQAHVPSELRGADFRAVAAKPALQDIFLGAAAREQQELTVFLVNGVMLHGTLAGFDQFSLLLDRGGQAQLVYKHAVSTLQPAHPLNLESYGEEEGAEA